jgi:serine/threonine-protein kinase
MISGTHLYMPPESFAGEPPHVTRDIFSTGAVLYELITGRRIHDGHQVWHGQLQRPARPSALVPDLHPGVEALIERAIAARPDRRFASAAQMRADVQQCLTGKRPA